MSSKKAKTELKKSTKPNYAALAREVLTANPRGLRSM
jgi:hypothetical protein